ncbi:MAG: hypothetical protein AAF846_28990 [Chloroflexota bacterium]
MHPKVRASNLETVTCPASKREMLVNGDNKWFVDIESDKAQAVINRVTSALNSAIPDGEPNYEFRRAYVSNLTKCKLGGSELPEVTDPAVGGNAGEN